jgi:hypothetical protein
MKFNYARCRLCGLDSFDVNNFNANFNAYELKDSHLVRVDLEGANPWCGCMCICLECCTDIHDSLLGAT